MIKLINFTRYDLDGWVVKNNPNPGWADEAWPLHDFYANGRLVGQYTAHKNVCLCSFYYPNRKNRVPTFSTPMDAKRAIENAYLSMAMP